MVAAPKRVTVLGSTGSVGANTLEIIRQGGDKFEIVALTANRNVSGLANQAKDFKPNLAVIADASMYRELAEALEGTGVRPAAGQEALLEAACLPADWIMAGIVGAAGLAPTLAAVKQGTIVALANKECLVAAGTLFMDAIRKHGTTLIPVDSEHSAIFQVFDFEQKDKVQRIVLTASGGPFRMLSVSQMAHVTPEQAMAHPNWNMGPKISVDSATMMNKGLELIEAHHLFGMDEARIEILVHPQSVVHSLVEYADGSLLGQLGKPDMRTPIAFALGWPDRLETEIQRFDLAEIGELTFERPSYDRFPALGLAREALKSGGSGSTILNAANEVAVAKFLAGRLGFLQIANIVDATMSNFSVRKLANIDDVISVDAEARRFADQAEYLGSAAE